MKLPYSEGRCHKCSSIVSRHIPQCDVQWVDELAEKDKTIERLRECVDYLWEVEPDKTEMLDVLQKCLKEIEGE